MRMHNAILKRSLHNIHNIAVGKPAFIWTNILITKFCTQRCLHCSIPQNASKSDVISSASFASIIDKLDQYGTQVLTISGGEPMLHPQLSDLIEYAKGKNFARIHILTTLYGPQKLIDRTLEAAFRTGVSLSVSFDGFGEIVDKIRGGKNVAEVVQKNLETIIEENRKIKKKLKYSANIVINRFNMHQVSKALDYLESIKCPADVDIYRWQSTHQSENDELKINDSAELRNVLKRVKESPIVFTPHWLIDGFPNYIKNDFHKACPYLDIPSIGSKFFIEPNGDVNVCIGDSIGNLLDQTPGDIFRSEAWRSRKIDFENCSGCWNTCYTTSAKLFRRENIREMYRTLRVFNG